MMQTIRVSAAGGCAPDGPMDADQQDGTGALWAAGAFLILAALIIIFIFEGAERIP